MYLCESCDKTFPKTPAGRKEWMMHRAQHKNPNAKPPAEEPKKKSMSAEEIKAEKKENLQQPILEYAWKGQCPECTTPIDSIVIEAGQPKGKIITVAFCSRCHKELRHRQVDKL